MVQNSFYFFPPNNQFLDQEMGDTKVSMKGLHEDMRIFANEVTQESKTVTEQLKKLGKTISFVF